MYDDWKREEQRKARRFAWRIRAIESVQKGKTPWMLTITLPSKAGRLKDRVQKLRKTIKPALEFFRKPGDVTLTAIYGIEVTDSDPDSATYLQFHPHVHVVIFSQLEFLPFGYNCIRCIVAMYGGGRTHVRKVDHAGYLTYLAKMSDMDRWTEEQRALYSSDLYKVRRFGVIGWDYGDPFITARATQMKRGVYAAYSIARAIGGLHGNAKKPECGQRLVVQHPS